MLHREVELHTVPFYWTVLLGRTIRYAGALNMSQFHKTVFVCIHVDYIHAVWCAGYGEGYTEMVLKGKFENMKFLALYLK